MKILLNTENAMSAMRLRDKIIKALKGELNGINIDTWSYVKAKDNYDIIYHNPEQYVETPEKNVLFRLLIDGEMLAITVAWWSKNPEPTDEMVCLHIGRLTEMLLRYFRSDFINFNVVD